MVPTFAVDWPPCRPRPGVRSLRGAGSDGADLFAHAGAVAGRQLTRGGLTYADHRSPRWLSWWLLDILPSSRACSRAASSSSGSRCHPQVTATRQRTEPPQLGGVATGKKRHDGDEAHVSSAVCRSGHAASGAVPQQLGHPFGQSVLPSPLPAMHCASLTAQRSKHRVRRWSGTLRAPPRSRPAIVHDEITGAGDSLVAHPMEAAGARAEKVAPTAVENRRRRARSAARVRSVVSGKVAKPPLSPGRHRQTRLVFANSLGSGNAGAQSAHRGRSACGNVPCSRTRRLRRRTESIPPRNRRSPRRSHPTSLPPTATARLGGAHHAKKARSTMWPLSPGLSPHGRSFNKSTGGLPARR
jgi:hypothetical protein